MKRDVYAWIDPWLEIEFLERRAGRSYDDGRNAAFSQLNDNPAAWKRALDQAVDDLANKIAFEQVMRHMDRHFMEFKEYQRWQQLRMQELLSISRPLVAFIQTNGKLSIDVRGGATKSENDLEFRFHTSRPFEYSVTMSSWNISNSRF